MKADEYGAREALLAHSDLLFDETGLRSLANRFEADLDKALHARSTADKVRYGVYKAAAAIGLIADVLGIDKPENGGTYGARQGSVRSLGTTARVALSVGVVPFAAYAERQ